MADEYNDFLMKAKEIFQLAEEEVMFDMKGQKLVKMALPRGITLSRKGFVDIGSKDEKEECVAVRIMVGTYKEVLEAFKDG